MKSIAIIIAILCFPLCWNVGAQSRDVVAVYTAARDQAHISFVAEAREWFSHLAKERGYTFRATSDWNVLNSDSLKHIKLLIFLDTRPALASHRRAFQEYMQRGGAWMGFHFAAFALTPSDYPQDWDWYHEQFLASGEYVSNTWRPTSAVLQIESKSHPVCRKVPARFASSPNEWYRWKNDLTKNADIDILASIHPTSFPLGTGPKAHEIWHEGYYPVVWTNKRYRMVYFNMGHNDIDYEGGTNKSLSSSFSSEAQNQMIANAVSWLLDGSGEVKKSK